MFTTFFNSIFASLSLMVKFLVSINISIITYLLILYIANNFRIITPILLLTT